VPRVDEPKRSIRFSAEDDALLRAASEASGRSVSALVQECVRRSLPQVTRDLKGEPASRSRPRAVTPQVGPKRETIQPHMVEPFKPNEGPSWQEGVIPARPLPSGIEAIKQNVTHPGGRLANVPKIPGVKTAKDLMLERQERLNEGKG
jgi:hypothetical protein